MRAINELGMLAELYERDERCRRKGMRNLLTSLCAVWLLAACAPVVEVTKIGNEYVQNAYSRQFWWPNWQRATYCGELDTNGYCPKPARAEVHTQIAMSASGQDAAVGMVKNAPFALMGFSFPRHRFSQTFESNGINQAYISTLNTPAGQFPWAK